LFDLETSPNIGYTWGRWDQNVIKFVRPWYILCVGYRWVGESETHVVGIDDYTGNDDWTDDSGVVQHIHELFDEADILVAHNGDKFDIPKARARMIVHGMTPPSPCRSVDTLKLARKEFAFNGNALNDVCQVLGLGAKAETGGFALWEGCMAGDPVAWATMKSYCGSDVELLEKLYVRLNPWAKTVPNLATISDRPASCPRCGADGANMIARKLVHNAVTSRRQFKCKACGGYSQGRAIIKSKAQYVV
jgi:hypothetical protein